VRRLFRVVPEIVFCFDGDRAGRAAAWRALQSCLPEVREGRQVRFLFLPDGEDPDSLVRKEGAAAFAARAAGSLALSDYLLDELRKQAGSDSLDGRARLAELARPLLTLLPAGVYRELLIDRLAQEVGLRREAWQQRWGRIEAGPRPHPAPATPPDAPALADPASHALLALSGIPGAAPVPPVWAGAAQRHALLVELLELTRQHRGSRRPSSDSGTAPRTASCRAAGGQMLVGEAAAPQELADSLQRIVAQGSEERMAELLSKAESAGLRLRRDEFRQLQRRDRPH
jgi:DNA primase